MGTQSTRDRIIEKADELFYRRGFEHTSFADIAEAVRISRGNFYHHFKSKDEILGAVIVRRLAKTRAMLERWELEGEDASARILGFIRMLLANQTQITSHGCPVGTLCTELAKLDHASRGDANQLFTLFRVWLREQFTALGRRADADELALQLLAWSQGVATLANAFHDPEFIEREVQRVTRWLRSCTRSRARRGGPELAPGS